MEQAQQNTAQELTAQAIPQQAVEDACFHSLGLIGRNCEYLEQHLARVGADAQSLQAVSDISAATAKLERTINELLSALEFLRAGQPPKLYPLDLCELLQQVAAQADMVRAQLGVTLELDYGGWTTCRVLADRDDVELLCLHLLHRCNIQIEFLWLLLLVTDEMLILGKYGILLHLRNRLTHIQCLKGLMIRKRIPQSHSGIDP